MIKVLKDIRGKEKGKRSTFLKVEDDEFYYIDSSYIPIMDQYETMVFECDKPEDEDNPTNEIVHWGDEIFCARYLEEEKSIMEHESLIETFEDVLFNFV